MSKTFVVVVIIAVIVIIAAPVYADSPLRKAQPAATDIEGQPNVERSGSPNDTGTQAQNGPCGPACRRNQATEPAAYVEPNDEPASEQEITAEPELQYRCYIVIVMNNYSEPVEAEPTLKLFDHTDRLPE